MAAELPAVDVGALEHRIGALDRCIEPGGQSRLLGRFKKIAANTKATVIIQHDARDKLPPFPAGAK